MQQYNPAASHAPAPPAAAQGKQPGMLAQMAATAGSVAVGSTIGHGLSSMLFGGGQAAPPVEQQAPPQQQQQNYQQGVSCEVQAKGIYIFYILWRSYTNVFLSDFTKCLEKADMQSCSWYLEQLKAVCLSDSLSQVPFLTTPQCQAAASPY